MPSSWGIRLDFDYALLTAAMRAVRAGAKLVATNDDATYPDNDGLLPGTGALLAAVERASGVEAVVAGKPNAPMVDLVSNHLGRDVHGVVVGDRPETDGRFAVALGYEFALVLTGVTGPDDLPVEPTPNSIGDDLLSTVESWVLTSTAVAPFPPAANRLSAHRGWRSCSMSLQDVVEQTRYPDL